MIEPALNMLRFAAEYDFSANDLDNVESAKKKQLLSESTLALCVNMIKVDKKLTAGQLEKLREVNSQSAVSDSHFNSLVKQLNRAGFMLVDYSVFKNNKALKQNVFKHLIVLAEMDGKLHVNEKGYLYDVAMNLDMLDAFKKYINKNTKPYEK